ncbi:hypothetical protein C5E08_14480 [Rathayibacter iranicus]|uniref:LytR family transcriptional regulator n=2 Tax=Rathayibacter iranicus TaxID=59737 RepID=A0AAD1AH29_9MICO|nr:LytR family transcriptional regulator [Rathayibacter iranicus]PPI57654.1 hypothetical protein C5E08_14480 [Rathayibacter iranicus]PPI68634.1 hypothetical protein C5E01_13535 [Rathayibacter iranicus]PWJ66680.1 LytR family transcriptional attenuator [Rathayibacter iranicus NCPPB 2253 = VKM Ac-1602]
MSDGTGGSGSRSPRPPVPISDPVSTRKVLAAVAGSLLIPGLGHRLLGARRAAAVRLGVAATASVGILVLCGMIASDPSLLVRLATDPMAVAVAGTLGAGLGLFWLSGPVTAAFLVRPRRRARAALALVTVVAAALPLGATTWWVTAAVAQHDLLTSVFASGRGITPVDGRYNILVMGLDADPNRDQVLLPDSLTLVSVDAVTGRSVLFGIPRTASNYLYPEGSALARALPEGTRCMAGCGVNHLYQYGATHPELYPGDPDPGAAAMRDAVEGYAGLPISATVSIRMTGFIDLVDALGGVSVVNTRPVLQAGVPDDGSGRPVEYGPPIPTGLQHLDGSQALWYARSRVNTSDADRSERQACLQAALFRQVDPLTILTRFTALARSGSENVATSLPTSALPALARLANSARTHPFVRVELGEPLTLPERPDTELIHRTVLAAIGGGDDSEATRISVPEPDAGVNGPAVSTPSAQGATEPACSVP